MRINKIKILAVACVASFISCNDARDIEQDGIISEENVWESVEDLQLGLNGAYGAYNPEGAINFNAIFTDNIKRGASNNGQGQGLYNFNLIPGTTEATGIWTGRYSAINRVNRVLEGVEDLEYDNSSDQEEEDEIKAELLALRALSHLDLFMYYTEDYSDPNGLAVPIMDFVPEITIQPTRNTVSETLEFIKNDLNEAAQLIGNPEEGSFFINGNTIKAIQARIALIEGDYPTAISLGEELVGTYPLSGQTEYEEMYQDLVPGESIFTVGRGLDDSEVVGLFYFNEPSLDGDPYLEVSNGLFNELQDGDVRKDVIIGSESVIVGENSDQNIILIDKYPGSDAGVRINDIKWIRSSEMQLIVAEAKARSNDLAGAATAIKELRDARFDSNTTAPSYSNLNAALQDILEERRLEFAFEGQRYLDIKRIGKDINAGITRNETDCASFSAPCGLPRSSFKFTLPIPQVELNANGAINQNNGY
ncbi:RagB/SusD family nutrient uptake outer membrane protein [Mesonia aquimarina]|uniref:RagB/SusD family nutrient uptake outer membrane protein n=1 Tax=Mesonia aquimarina TaxID=1504967 RepID=UPI0013CEA8F8|nr:RagB/SusD family nutrient uptake outer membrane protein [Mesonia aquimarina]